jgi:hypothetical protein
MVTVHDAPDDRSQPVHDDGLLPKGCAVNVTVEPIARYTLHVGADTHLTANRWM